MYSRFKASHTFPRAHVDDVCYCEVHHAAYHNDMQWVQKDFHNRITDPAPPRVVGGESGIDSIQNVILLQSDVHDARITISFVSILMFAFFYYLYALLILISHSNSVDTELSHLVLASTHSLETFYSITS